MNNISKSLALIVITLACMALVVYGQALSLLRPIAAILLVLCIPGYAVTRTAFLSQAWGRPERILFSLGGSLSLAVLSGLVLNWSPWGLQTTSWTLFLGGITLVATAIGFVWQRDDRIRWTKLGRVQLRNVALLALASVLIASGYSVAAYGARLRPESQFTQLWMLPADESARAVRIGILNEENATIDYRLVLRAGVDVIQEWPIISLQAGEEWQAVVTLTPDGAGGDLVASLYRQDEPNAVYRYVTLRSQG